MIWTEHEAVLYVGNEKDYLARLKRRQVWTPRNFDEITKDYPEWRERILSLSVKDFRPTEE